MEITLELIIALITGFAIGCFITTLISTLLYSSHQKKLEHNMQNRRSIINSIGTLCANIENAFSAYKIGTMKYHTLREVIVAKLNGINTALQGNLDILDPFYVKNIERFINDQNKFLLRGDKENVEAAKDETLRDEADKPLKTDQSTPKKESVEETIVEVLDLPKKQSDIDTHVSGEENLVSEEIEIPEQKPEETGEVEEFELPEQKSEETGEVEEFELPEQKPEETGEVEEFELPEQKPEETGETKPEDSIKEQIEQDSVETKETLSSFESEVTESISVDKVEEIFEPSTKSKDTDTPEESSVQTEEEYIEPAKGYSEPVVDELKDEMEDEIVFEKQEDPISEKSISIEEYPPPDEAQEIKEEFEVGKVLKEEEAQQGIEEEYKAQKPKAIPQESIPLFDNEETIATSEIDSKSIDPQMREMESEEESAFDIESARFDDTFPTITSDTDEEEEPIKGTPVFDSSFDVEATQVYNVEDLLKNSSVESETSKPTRSMESLKKGEEIAEQSSDEEDTMPREEVFELNMQKETTTQKKTIKQDSKKSKSDSLITGNDVMDKMDNFFGFDNE